MLDGAGVAAAVPDRFEAEDAELSGVIVDDLHGGFTGGGYADFVRGSGGYIFWHVNVQEAGRYELRFRYANGGSGDRPLEFRVNWERLDERLSFPRTGAWSRDVWNTVAVEADLKAGENVVQLISVGFNGSNFDSLTVTRQQHPTPPITLDAEAATLGGAAKGSRAHAGYTGTGYVDFIRDAGDSMEWTLDVPQGPLGGTSSHSALRTAACATARWSCG
jgi:hypothetical protein